MSEEKLETLEEEVVEVLEDEEEQTTFDVDNDFFKAAQEVGDIEILDVEEAE